MRKCCGLGQVYVTGGSSGGGADSSQRCVDYASSSHQSSTLIEVSQQLFFGNHPNADDFDIDAGFPRNCSQGGLMLLEPEAMMSDRFYPLASGQLVVPHRFWLFEPDSQCMEDFFFDQDFNKVRRSAIICTDRIGPFPDRAVDRHGQLRLDFIQDSSVGLAASPLMDLAGRKVIRKCCDTNEVYSVANHSCMAKTGYATQYFDDMASQKGDIFFRIGLLDCPDQQQAAEFELTPSGRLRYRLDDDGGVDWAGETADYCLDDFVVFFEDDLPETINLASFCPARSKPKEDPEIPVEPIDDEPNNADSSKAIGVPKCCPTGQLMENRTCQSFKLGGDIKSDRLESIILRAFQQFSLVGNATSGVLVPNMSLPCGYGTSYPLVRMSQSRALARPLFRRSAAQQDGDGQVSFSLHYYVERYWDFNATVKHFCLDLEQFRTSGEVYYEPSVWYCLSPSHVSGHYPILLYISSAALVLTFVIYFIIPATGANLILSVQRRFFIFFFLV